VVAVVSAAGNRKICRWVGREFSDAFVLSLHFGLLIIPVDIERCACTFTNYELRRLRSCLRNTEQYIKNLTKFR